MIARPAPADELTIRVGVNGVDHEVKVEARLLLVHLIREVLGLTGTHIGCDTGHCGTCTLLLDGTPVRSCTVFAVQTHGREVITPEGLARGEQLHPIQDAFWEQHGLACGFCTPGMMLSAYGLLQRNPAPADDEIRRAIAGNLCRCMNYTDIVNAISAAAEKMQARNGD
jgi:carbon-monoxide dehydrogenase small subunit